MNKMWLIVLTAALPACVVTTSSPATLLTPLEIQAIQSRDFESVKSITFASTLSVFQDIGYIVESADLVTGFITADSPTDSTTSFWTGTSTSTNTRATAFIEEIRPGFTRVRLNFVATSQKSTEYGRNKSKDTPIYDAVVYQNAFERIENAIFLRTGTS